MFMSAFVVCGKKAQGTRLPTVLLQVDKHSSFTLQWTPVPQVLTVPPFTSIPTVAYFRYTNRFSDQAQSFGLVRD